MNDKYLRITFIRNLSRFNKILYCDLYFIFVNVYDEYLKDEIMIKKLYLIANYEKEERRSETLCKRRSGVKINYK